MQFLLEKTFYHEWDGDKANLWMLWKDEMIWLEESNLKYGLIWMKLLQQIHPCSK